MKPKGRVLVLLCVLLALAALPTGATAKPGHFVLPPSFSIDATLPKSNGFRISVISSGHREVNVIARRQGEVAVYSAPGTASRHGVSADLGRFGHMQMKFEGSTHLIKNAKGCKGRRTIQGTGSFHGSFRFRGREDFVSVKAQGFRGQYQRSFRQVCNRSGSEVAITVVRRHGRGADRRRARFTGDILEAESHTDGRTTSFNAISLDIFDSQPFVSASVSETIGRVQLWSFTQPRGTRTAVAFSDPGADPQTATVRPVAPFVGEASYVKPKGEPAQWTGDLRVPIAGYGTLPLTGPDFQASACHGNLQSFSSCEKQFKALRR